MARTAARHPPRYRQIADRLADDILSGRLETGQRLPSERTIAQRHDLSRMTARQAVELLVRRGLVFRRPGSGTYVAPARVQHTLQRFAGFSEQMRAQGIEPDGRLLSVCRTDNGDDDARDALGLGAGESCWVMRRVRFGDHEPLLVEESHVPAALCPDLDRNNLAHLSLYQLLRERYGVDPVRAQQTIEPTVCEPDDARHLGARPGTPAIVVTRVAFDRGGQPVEFARDVYRGDRARFVVDLHV